MLQKGYLDQIGIEFHQKLIGAIVNWPTQNRRTLWGSMVLFEGILGLFSNLPSFDATEGLFRSNWDTISPASDCHSKMEDP